MHLRLLAATAAAFAFGAPAMAAVTLHNDSITAGATFNRTLSGSPPTQLSSVGTNVFYDVIQFSVTDTGDYSIAMDADNDAFDTYLLLYQGSFNPLSPLTNILVANDDAGPGANSLIGSVNLSASATYFAVASTFNNGVTGAYRLTWTGAGNSAAIVGGVGAVPEPGTWAMMILGFGLVGSALRSRRQSVKVSFG